MPEFGPHIVPVPGSGGGGGGAGSTGATGPTGPTGATGPDGKFYASSTAPVSPTEGDGWYNTDTGQLYVYYDSYWVETGTGSIGPAGVSGSPGATGPTGPLGFALVGGL